MLDYRVTQFSIRFLLDRADADVAGDRAVESVERRFYPVVGENRRGHLSLAAIFTEYKTNAAAAAIDAVSPRRRRRRWRRLIQMRPWRRPTLKAGCCGSTRRPTPADRDTAFVIAIAAIHWVIIGGHDGGGRRRRRSDRRRGDREDRWHRWDGAAERANCE